MSCSTTSECGKSYNARVELHNAVEVILSSSPSAHKDEIPPSFASPEQPIKRGNANGGNFAKHIRFCSDRQKENVYLNKTRRTIQEQDNSFESSAEEKNEFNGDEQQDVVKVLLSGSSSVNENEMSVSDASPEASTKRTIKSRSNPVKLYQCSHCGSKFLKKVEMLLHERTHLESSLKCDNCLQVFAHLGSFTMHIRFCSYRPNENGSFECAECGKSYRTRDKLKDHLRYHKAKKHKCSVCGRAFTYPSQMNIHMVTHTGAKPFYCKFCPRSFAASKNLHSHIRLHHAKEQEST